MKQTVRDQQKQAPNQTKKPSPSGQASPSTSFSDHIAELRRRAFFVLLIFVIASSLAYNYRDTLLAVIMAPLEGAKLIYLTPGGGFNFIFQISLYAGLLAAAPMLMYQLYGFIRPALPTRAQRSSGIVVAVAFLLMLCGVAFGYFVAVPSALHFLSTFAGDTVTPSLTADSYLSFFLAYIAGLGILFELPLLLLFLHWIHPMTPGKLLKSQRFAILFAFVAAALITPTPDALNQGMIAVPLILIYQLGVVAVLIAIRRDRRRLVIQEKERSKQEEYPKETPPPPPSLPVATVSQARPPRPVARQRALNGFTQYTAPPSRPPRTHLTPPPRTASLPRVTRPPYRRQMSIDGMIGQ